MFKQTHEGLNCVVRNIGCLALLVCFFIPTHVWGWGKEGHKIICHIAWQELSSEAKAGIKELLSHDPAPSFPASCLWADQIRDLPSYEWTRPLHYINLPEGQTHINWKDVCPDPPGCVVSGIQRYFSLLKESTATRVEKTQALKFLCHFVGDLHQPLHAGRQEDRGGSIIEVTIFGRSTSLHKVWDTVILKQSPKPWMQMARELHNALTSVDRAFWKMSGPREWAWESYRIAELQAYKKPEQGWALDKDYVEEHLATIFSRLQMAGVRLADLLNRIPWSSVH